MCGDVVLKEQCLGCGPEWKAALQSKRLAGIGQIVFTKIRECLPLFKCQLISGVKPPSVITNGKLLDRIYR